MQITIKHPQLGDARPVIAEESFPEFAAVGWVKVGPVDEDSANVSPKKAKASAPAADNPTASVPADDENKEQ